MSLQRIKLVFAALVVLVAASATAQTRHVVIIHSNDTHGHLIPYSLPSHVPASDPSSAMPDRQNVGGVARRATVINRIRATSPLVRCFDAGDNMDGTLFSTEYRDKADYAALNAMHYDYCVTGNHEYSLTANELRQLLTTVTPQMVVANITDRVTHKPIAAPYVIDNWDGVRVAVAGLVTFETRGYRAAKEAFDVRNPVEVARELVPELRKKADLVVLVTHVGVAVDQQLAAEIPGIDVIVGGHSHTRLAHGIYQATKHPGARDPKGTIIVQTGSYGAELGRLDLDLEKTGGHWRIAHYSDSLIALTSAIPDDAAVKSLIDGYWKPIYDKYHDTLGVAHGDFTDYQDEPSTNYYLVSDACQQFGKCEFSLQNIGGVRAPLVAGPITRYDLVSMVPYVDTLYSATIKGTSLDSLLNETFAQPSRELHYTIHHWKADGTNHEERWKIGEISLNGYAIHPDSIYTFTSSDYFMQSVHNHLLSFKPLDRTTIDALAGYVMQQKAIEPSPDDRIKLKEE